MGYISVSLELLPQYYVKLGLDDRSLLIRLAPIKELNLDVLFILYLEMV